MNRYNNLFFNPSLFTIDKQPIKFYLDGYSNDDVNEIARIIEAFGGKLSEPDEGTIIFSEPERPATTNYARFHIQYLRDSIAFRQLQDLEKYRIPLIPKHSMESAIKRECLEFDQYSDDIRYLRSDLRQIPSTSSGIENKSTVSKGVNKPLENGESSVDFETNCKMCDNNNQRFTGKIMSSFVSVGKHSHRCSRNRKFARVDNLK